METKVVKIISETEVVLGLGSNKGVEEGMRFVIYEPDEEIRDPETKESLGYLEIVKGYVRVEHVMPNMCTAKTNYRTETRFERVNLLNPLGALSLPSLLNLQVPRTVTVGDTLLVNEDDKDDEYANRDRTVRVGDRAREVAE